MLYILYIIIAFFIIGASLGSAALCFMERDDKKSWVTGRSACPVCGKTLHWYELVPVVSYIAQKGKCRGCKSIIPLYTLGMELYGGFMLAVCGGLFVKSQLYSGVFLVITVLGYIVLTKYMVNRHIKQTNQRKE